MANALLTRSSSPAQSLEVGSVVALLDAAAQRAKQPHDESPEAIVVESPESESREALAEPVAAES